MPGSTRPSSGQMAAEPSEPDARTGQQLERRPPAPVLVDVQAVAGGLVGRQGQAVQQAPAIVQGCALAGERLAAAGLDQPQGQSGWRQALVGVVGAQAQAVFGARGEHAIGLGDAARHQVVDHHAHVAVGARDDENRARRRPPSARR